MISSAPGCRQAPAPAGGRYAGFSRAYRERCIAVGERETLAAAAALRALHATG